MNDLSQLIRWKWRTPLSGPVLCVRNGYNEAPGHVTIYSITVLQFQYLLEMH